LAYTGAYQSVDVSVIPIAALDRLEIVADGASALYGSDAVAGVANVILKRDYNGLNTSARFGASTDGGNQQQEYSLVAGHRWNTGGFMVAYDFSHNTPIQASQRSYAAATSPGLSLLPSLTQHNVVLTGHKALTDSWSSISTDFTTTDRAGAPMPTQRWATRATAEPSCL
jgi:outer membrane receptor protein involved in Fe transport